MADFKKIAQEIIDAVGGRENIVSFAHCATRLRIMVGDQQKIDQEKVEGIELVKGAFFNSGQYQIILGTGNVNKVYEQVEGLGVQTTSKNDQAQEAAKQGNFLQRAVRTFGDVFVPIIPVLVATGLFMGLRGLLTQEVVLGWFGMTPADVSQNFILFTQVLTDTAFVFLPALIAWSTFRVFGGTPVIGLVLGLMLVNPSLPNAWDVASGAVEPITMFGFIPVVGYQSSVLPALITGILGAKLEKQLRKIIPSALDLILTPFLTLLIMIVLALFAIGPVFHSLENVILDATHFLLSAPFGLSGLILGGLYQLIVVTGVHHVFNLVEIQLLSEGGNPFNAIITCSIAAQGGAALAVAMKTKSTKLKSLAYPSALSAFLGITEPAIFGVNLRYGKPFVMGLIGGAAGGFVASLFKLEATGMSVTAIPGMLLYMNSQILLYIAVNLLAAGLAFFLTYSFGYSDKMQNETK